MTALLADITAAVLVLAFVADYGRRSAAHSGCECGCGDPAPIHNQPGRRA